MLLIPSRIIHNLSANCYIIRSAPKPEFRIDNILYPYREIYYDEIEIMNSQQMVDDTLMIICYLLKCPPWELNIMSSTKGLVAGPLCMKTVDDEIITCMSPGGNLRVMVDTRICDYHCNVNFSLRRYDNTSSYKFEKYGIENIGQMCAYR